MLRVEDIPAEGDKPMLTVGRFRRILAQVDRKVRLAYDARLTIEIGRPGEPCASTMLHRSASRARKR